MEKTYSPAQIQRSLSRFRDYGSDILKSNHQSFDDRLQMFFHFCTTDIFLSEIHNQIIYVSSGDFDSWYKERICTYKGSSGSGKLIFPTDIDNRLSMMYILCLKIYNKDIKFLDFCTKFFKHQVSINYYISDFNEIITRPLLRELDYKFDDMQDKFPSDENTNITIPMIQIIHHATNVVQQNACGNNITQTANQHINSEIQKLLSNLKETIENNYTTPSDIKDNLDTVDVVKEELEKDNPRKTVITRLLDTLPAIEAISTVSAKIIDLIS